MYTIEMATAFKEIIAPENFGVTLYDAEDYITMVIDPKDIQDLITNNPEYNSNWDDFLSSNAGTMMIELFA